MNTCEERPASKCPLPRNTNTNTNTIQIQIQYKYKYRTQIQIQIQNTNTNTEVYKCLIGGDFWELPFRNGSGPASLCVGPRHSTDVLRLLKQQGVSVEVLWMKIFKDDGR